jgi:hypothetical protein
MNASTFALAFSLADPNVEWTAWVGSKNVLPVLMINACGLIHSTRYSSFQRDYLRHVEVERFRVVSRCRCARHDGNRQYS